VILPGAFAVCDFRTLDNVRRIDVRVSLNRLQSKTMRLPSNKIRRAVHRNATTLNSAFDLVFAKQEELATLFINSNATSMRIHEISLGISPSSSRYNPFGGDGGSSQQQLTRNLTESHCDDVDRRLDTDAAPIAVEIIYTLPAGMGVHQPRRSRCLLPRATRNKVAKAHCAGLRTAGSGDHRHPS